MKTEEAEAGSVEVNCEYSEKGHRRLTLEPSLDRLGLGRTWQTSPGEELWSTLCYNTDTDVQVTISLSHYKAHPNQTMLAFHIVLSSMVLATVVGGCVPRPAQLGLGQ